ncbi:hypothetical protein IGI04_040671 [Brassica rapa subsp. trilocularis]|uniref:Uncharacterized protein n=1 Tax=Brassica rapa subsp. trilocularis TaxID=1813537 RepID=A0ABQ7KRG0_BRACM|nr:hypothetical protein IGI04_040671 [Brassica rapa subsp. trilocularis]
MAQHKPHGGGRSLLPPFTVKRALSKGYGEVSLAGEPLGRAFVVFGLLAGGVEEVQFFGTVLMETPTHFISISLGHRRHVFLSTYRASIYKDSSSSYDHNDKMLDDKIQGEEASEPCLAGKRRKKTEKSSSALPPKPRKLVAHKKLMKGAFKTRTVRVLHVKELSVFDSA